MTNLENATIAMGYDRSVFAKLFASELTEFFLDKFDLSKLGKGGFTHELAAKALCNIINDIDPLSDALRARALALLEQIVGMSMDSQNVNVVQDLLHDGKTIEEIQKKSLTKIPA